MACRPSYQGSRLVMDCPTCGLGLTTSACLNSHLKTISTLESPWKTMRYEEETVVDLDEEKSRIFFEYAGIVRQVEAIIIDQKIYGRQDDDAYAKRKKLMRDFYDFLFMNPLIAARTLEDYTEPYPEKQAFVEGHNTFRAWANGILATYKKSRLYLLTKQSNDLRGAFLSTLGLKSLQFLQNFLLTIPANSKPIDSPFNPVDLGFGIKAKVYEVEGAEANLYVQENPAIENLPQELQKMLKDAIAEGMKESREIVDYTTIFDSRMREYTQQFIDKAALAKTPITHQQALSMGREAAAWVVGLGSPIENMALDDENITDIYIDSENSPIYIEHAKFGLCHTLWRYNKEMLQKAFDNVVASTDRSRKFDDKNPVVDIVLTRLSMRCHLQRSPATFGELQAALRIMRPTPFTYPQYLNLNSFTPFFAGYDDVMVSLGSSEAVLGLKGVGKTCFTAAKISAIGAKRRILPIQDIEEIPSRAFRKRGFHIGPMRVQSSEKEEMGGMGNNELDLVSMVNAALRMGDACVIINEVRSRVAVQGVMNLINTQPGIFLLYNLHSQSLKDVQDRFELVFGIPAASMLNTDRYSFLRKVRFGRKSRVYRMLGTEYETDQEARKFVEVFTLTRADTLEGTTVKCNFLDNPEASAASLSNIDLSKLKKTLKIKFIPPALLRRSAESGFSPEHFILEAFFKGKIYSQILDASRKYDDKMLLEIDFVLKCLSLVSNMIKLADSKGEIDFAKIDLQWQKEFPLLVKKDIAERAAVGLKTPASAKEAAAPPPAPSRAKKQAPPRVPVQEELAEEEESEESAEDS